MVLGCIALLGAAPGCISPKGFRCTTSSECSGGQCEATGYCSLVASDCPGGRRYVFEAGPFSGRCLETPDGGLDGNIDGPEDAMGDGPVSGACLLSLGVGRAHACIAKGNHESYCWGSNGYGQLGDSTTTSQAMLSRVSSLESFVEIAGGWNHSCARNTEGKVWCWGDNSSFAAGVGTGSNVVIPAPAQSFGGGQVTGAVELRLGDSYSCARMQDGTVHCWGFDGSGQLGDGLLGTRAAAKPVLLNGTQTPLPSTTALATGASHACAVSAGVAHCWGEGTAKQLGQGVAENRSGAGPVLGPNGTGTLDGVVSVAAGRYHSCALRQGGTVWCWGGNDMGQLGLGDQTVRDFPTQVTLPQAALAIVAHLDQSCALLADRTALCWGAGSNGELGSGDGFARTRVTTPSPLLQEDGTALGGIAELGLGASFGCARLEAGAIHCWGTGQDGELANGITSYTFAPPTTVTEPSGGAFLGATRIFAAGSSTCALKGDQTLWCWGGNSAGQLGTGNTNTTVHPTQASLTGILQVDLGGATTCARTAAGISCWGTNSQGELATDPTTTPYSATPLPISVTGTLVDVSVGNLHACALDALGAVFCWGYNSRAQLGYTPVGGASYSTTPTAVSGIAGTPTQISAGEESTCARTSDGTAWCWGQLGELGTGSSSLTSTRMTPGQVTGNPGAADVQTMVDRLETGEGHRCLLRADGALRCWAENTDGELGLGTNTWGLYPATVNVTSPSRVSLGSEHTCAVLQSGALYCWGKNDFGQLGLPGTSDQRWPAEVLPAGSATDVAAGLFHTCVLKTDNTIVCFGSFATGQLGDGRSAVAPFARAVPGVCP